ncbi:7256_t:CDS:1, partial [Paraglomus occultum]
APSVHLWRSTVEDVIRWYKDARLNLLSLSCVAKALEKPKNEEKDNSRQDWYLMTDKNTAFALVTL